MTKKPFLYLKRSRYLIIFVSISVFSCCKPNENDEAYRVANRNNSLSKMMYLSKRLDCFDGSANIDSINDVSDWMRKSAEPYPEGAIIDPLTNKEFQYHNLGGSFGLCWILLSPGPDGVWDSIVSEGEFHQYDSTNGTASGGDFLFSDKFNPDMFFWSESSGKRRGKWERGALGWEKKD